MTEPLRWVPAPARPDLLAPPVQAALDKCPYAGQVQVADIDPELADTAAFCDRYGVAAVGQLRGGQRLPWRAGPAGRRRRLGWPGRDVNRVMRRHLGARKAFAAMDAAVARPGWSAASRRSGLGGWPLLVDAAGQQGRPGS